MTQKLTTALVFCTVLFCHPMHATSHVKNVAATAVLAAGALTQAKQKPKKVMQNSKEATFTFHGNDTASVEDVFGNDLGTRRTNNNNPLDHQPIALIKENDQSAVYVGSTELKGGQKYVYAAGNVASMDTHVSVLISDSGIALELSVKDTTSFFGSSNYLEVKILTDKDDCIKAMNFTIQINAGGYFNKTYHYNIHNPASFGENAHRVVVYHQTAWPLSAIVSGTKACSKHIAYQGYFEDARTAFSMMHAVAQLLKAQMTS